MGNMRTCSCFGHATVLVTEELKERVESEIDCAIREGVRVFLFGGLSDFDDLVYTTVSKKREEHKDLDIRRVFCFASDGDMRKPPHWFKRREYEEYRVPPKKFDWWYKALYFRNCAMIDESDLVLFYAEKREKSGAYKAYRYALKERKRVVNFA